MFEPFVIPSSELDGKRRAAPHAKPQQDRGEEHHQRVGGADCGERIRSQKPPDDQGIRHIVKLLQEVAGHHGESEF